MWFGRFTLYQKPFFFVYACHICIISQHKDKIFLFKVITTQKLKFNKISNLKLSLYFKFRVKNNFS